MCIRDSSLIVTVAPSAPHPVSYTHLDVYKRQQLAQQDVACHTFCKGTYQHHRATGINNMKRVLLGGLLAIASMQATPAVAVTPVAGESVLTMRVDGELTIGTEGQVVAYNIRSKLDPTLQALLDKTIPVSSTHLDVYKRQGKPQRACAA